MERGVPGHNDDVGEAGLAGHEGGVERAGHQGPQATPAESIVLEDATQERCRVVDHGRDVDRAVVVRISLRAEEG